MRVYKYQLKHDSADRIVEKLETVAGKTIAWKYTYDSKGRLAEAYLDGRMVCQCRYDNKGRRTQDYFPRTIGTRVRNYRYTMDNRLESAGNNGYNHDKQGFRSIWNSGGRYTLYEYAPDYRLLAVEVEGEDARFTFIHDENGQRAAKLFNGEPVEAYRWLDFIRLAGFHDGHNGHEFFYDEDARTPFAMRRDDGGLYYLHYDQVGSLRVVANRSGNVIKEILYDPFGGVIEDTNPDFRIPIGFAGGLHDRDLGFVRFGWRDYDTFTGRWTVPDPMGDAGGDDDWYGYCLDDPVNGVDSLGLFAFTAAGVAAAMAIGRVASVYGPSIASAARTYGPAAYTAGMQALDKAKVGIQSLSWAWDKYSGYVARNAQRMKEDQQRRTREKEKDAKKAAADAAKKAEEKRAARVEQARVEERAQKPAEAQTQQQNRERAREFERRAGEAIDSGNHSYGGSSSNIGARGGSYNGYGR